MAPILLFFLILSASPAIATDDLEHGVSITKKECDKLIRLHNMANPDYVPGVDVHGNKVAGADLNGSNAAEMPDEITFDIGVDLAERYDMPAGFYGKGSIGQIKVKGRDVYWNGKKLHQSENDTVLDACKAQYDQK